MADVGDVYLGITGLMTLLPSYGRTYNSSTVEMSRVEQMASGRTVKEVIAKKKKFTLSWSMIDQTDVTTLETLYDMSLLVPNLVFETYESAVSETFDVLMQPIDKTRILIIGDGLWGGVTVELSEV